MTNASKPGTASRIHAEVDYDRDGKQTGFLRLLHSVHRSAYGWIPIPVGCIRNGDGPRVLLMAGNHGDEYEGQIAVASLLRELRVDDVRGTIIFLSSANFPAAMAGTRTSPIDEGNLNRSFTGEAQSGVTAQIAHYIEQVLLSRSDYLFDMHSGGSSLMYVPSALGKLGSDPAQTARTVELMKQFGAPVSYVVESLQGEERTSNAAAARHGVVAMGSELGGGGTLTPAALHLALQGLKRVLKSIGSLRQTIATDPPPPTRLMQVRGPDYYVYATEHGLFEPRVELGDDVVAGQTAGFIHCQDTPWREPVEVQFQREGTVLCKRVPCQSQRGDCLFHLGTPFLGQAGGT